MKIGRLVIRPELLSEEWHEGRRFCVADNDSSETIGVLIWCGHEATAFFIFL